MTHVPLPAQLCLVSEFVTPREAAAAFGVSLKTLRDWEKRGKLLSTRTPGGHRRYNIRSVEGWRELVNSSFKLCHPEYETETGLRRRSAPTEAGIEARGRLLAELGRRARVTAEEALRAADEMLAEEAGRQDGETCGTCERFWGERSPETCPRRRIRQTDFGCTQWTPIAKRRG